MASSEPLLPPEERYLCLSQVLDTVERGEVPEDSLGRHIRISNTARRTLTARISQALETATQSIEANDKDLSVVKEALNIIARCNKMPTMSGKLYPSLWLDHFAHDALED